MTDHPADREVDGYLEDLYHAPALPARQVGLQRAATLLDRLGNPHRGFRSVHITGSSGKGSTTTMVGSILQHAGFTTGYFRSPHLQRYRERVAVNGQEIEPEAWRRVFVQARDVAEAMKRNELPGYTLGRPSLSELLFAMCCLHFQHEGVEWASIETGMGGRFDATNTLTSDVAVITNVSLEHTQILGKTVAAIAAEKAAIIKPHTYAVTASRDPDALRVIEERATSVEARLIRIPADVRAHVLGETLEGQVLDIHGRDFRLNVTLPVVGAFQAVNAATAVAAALALEARGVVQVHDGIGAGLAAVRIPGRFEIFPGRPLVVLDGAHNPAACLELADSIRTLLVGRDVTLVFGAMADKNIDAMADSLASVAARVLCTPVPNSERGALPDATAELFRLRGVHVEVTEGALQALQRARATTGEPGVIVVCGSLYLVGEVRQTLIHAGATR